MKPLRTGPRLCPAPQPWSITNALYDFLLRSSPAFLAFPHNSLNQIHVTATLNTPFPMKITQWLGLSFLVIALNASRALGQDASASKTDPAVLQPLGNGWTPIFNGTNLDDWNAEPEYWKMEGGVLHGHTPGTQNHHYAYTKTNYTDFELHADVKLIGNNSGICIRIAPKNFDNVPGYQVDMGDGYWGCLWEEHGRGKVVDYPAAEAAKLLHKEDWNHYYIRAAGHHIEAWLNGVKTIDVVDDKGLLTGPLGFQLCHGQGKMTDASFKNVVYRPLTAMPKS